MGLSEAYNIGSNASWVLSEGECDMSISFLFWRSETHHTWINCSINFMIFYVVTAKPFRSSGYIFTAYLICQTQ